MMDGMDLTQLRRLAENASGSSFIASSPAMAVCYAGLLYAKTQSPDDAFLYAQTLAKNGQEKRAVRLLERSGLLDPQFQPFEKRLEAVLLAVRSLATLDEWEQVLDLLEDASLPTRTSSGVGDDAEWVPVPPLPLDDGDDIGWAAFATAVHPSPHTVHPISRLCLWRGRAYLETGHPTRAAVYWKRALQIDSKCVEALDFLLGRRIVAPQEAYELITGLTLEPEVEWLRHYYLARIDLPPQDLTEDVKTNTKSGLATTPLFSMNGTAVDASSINITSPFMTTADITATDGSFEKDSSKTKTMKSAIQRDVDKAFNKLWEGYKLNQSSDLLAMAANRCYRRYDVQGSLKYCEDLSVIDPLCPTAGYVYIATLVALGHKRRLFGVAHDWVEASPKTARAWFAVGSYYYACERYRVAQRHFCRATRLDPRCPEAWIAFGCSFAACDESDQALASFRAAQRLAPGDHSSLLYMGMEYLRTNHLALAQHFLTSAFKTSGGDPLCLHELGVLAFLKGEHDAAIQWYLRGLSACQQSLKSTKAEDLIDACKDSYWEPTLFNLGQCYRKTRAFHLASRCFERCLALNPVSCQQIHILRCTWLIACLHFQLQNHPSIYAALAFTRHLTGDVDSAIDLYHQALSRKPDDPFSSEMLNRALQEALSGKLILNDIATTDGHLSRISGGAKEEGVASRQASNLEWSRRDASMMSEDGMNLSMDSSSTDVWT
jgi:anaphase-promoting complex subunit 6